MKRSLFQFSWQFRGGVSLWLVGLLVSIFMTQPVYAGGVVGNGTSASCTEAAFDTALSGGGNVTFNCGGAKTITLTFYKQIADNTTINGSNLITLSGSNSFLFQVFFAKTLTLQNITLSNGSSNVAGAIENFGTTTILNSQLVNNRSSNTGGAILNHGTLNLTNSILSNNQATNNGGGIYNNSGDIIVSGSQFVSNIISGTTGTGGAIANQSGSLIIQNSTFNNNHGFDGGALYLNNGTTTIISTSTIISNSAGYGGGIENSGVVTLSNATLTLNRATVGDGGGIWNLSGQLNLREVTVSNNQATTTGGGISSYGISLALNNVTISGNTAGDHGGGLYSTATAELTNVTLSGNRTTGVGKGGGGMYQGSSGSASLTYVTVVGNNAAFGAGVYKDSAVGMFLQNTLLANNTTGNCDGVVDSLGYNLSSDSNCGNFIQTGDQQNVSLSLGPLANNGGSTFTHMPLPGNPAIEGGQCAIGITTDQRGGTRPSGNKCDVGAVEADAMVPIAYLPIILK